MLRIEDKSALLLDGALRRVQDLSQHTDMQRPNQTRQRENPLYEIVLNRDVVIHDHEFRIAFRSEMRVSGLEAACATDII